MKFRTGLGKRTGKLAYTYYRRIVFARQTIPESADHGLGPAEAFPAFAEDVPSFSFVSIPGSNVRPSPTDWSPLSAAAATHFFSRVHKDAVDAREPPGHNEIFSVSFLLRRARTRAYVASRSRPYIQVRSEQASCVFHRFE